MTPPRAAIVLVLCCVLPAAILFGVNAAKGAPPRAWHPAECTRYCHDHGCRHDPVLPDLLTADDGLYGWTIDALYAAGGLTGLDSATGYGVANLVLLCAGWPGAMLALLAIGLAQRVRLRRLRRRR